MSAQKKFGAFAGVFTPSILTILGVIMYMRLGWVVGQAGLITAIGIILMAHLISITTGLSISSIATDKKIKTGGIYYMLSRSLGLPMGGSIGLTMFVGTALSISLYIIGFCENFLGIEMIREISGLGNTISDYRILGSIVLMLLVVIAFISTSIAIKTQFFILGAIALSLLSIGLGLFTGDPNNNGGISWMPVAGGASVTTVFAIFFPAVTGFTAGVAMSGDLKNPQKNIPFGTMAAIATGFVVYVGLAIGFALLIDRSLLIEDTNFLMKIAWSSPLVVAGIWGATLSSALGGILGGPRILQAMSRDRITPKVFGRGYGINNEPRNALLLTFLIAEAGILIGELDVVAAIVSMFYIAAYGFINLAFALERWASADFRPSFKISMWIGIIGFAACFGVMFKLNTPVMFLAMFILAGIYFYIKRKKLELDFGDVWQSVWSSIARFILHRIDRKGLEERNWRPNIVLFSGGSRNRPHLIQFGKDLVGNQGFLSNFDLILNKSSSVLFKKHQQSVEDEFTRKNEGIFTRRQECKDIYEGIEAISSTYGFSGVEPNTLLFGWARQSQNPVRFARMIRTLAELDLNILMMDYDKDTGFGKREIIDVWCRGGGNNCNLVLSLIKFMWLSETWKNARIRILMINPVNDEKEMLIRDVENILESVRMDAEIKIINNQIEKRPVNELIEVESSNSDIVFLGIPMIREGEEQDYVNQVNKLCQNVGTVVLVKASSYFKNLEIGHEKGMVKHDKSDYTENDVDLVISRRIKIPEISYPGDPESALHLKSIYEAVKKTNDDVFNGYVADLFSLNRTVYAEIVRAAGRNLNSLEQKMDDIKSDEEWKESISNTFRDIFKDSSLILENHGTDTFAEQQKILDEIISRYSELYNNIIKNAPDIYLRSISRQDLQLKKGDHWGTMVYKLRKRAFFGPLRKTKKQKVRFRRLVASHFDQQFIAELTEVMRNWGMISIQQVIKTQEINNRIFDTYFMLNKLQPGQEASSLINEKIQAVDRYRTQVDKLNESSLQTFYTLLMNKTLFIVRQIGKELDNAHIRSFIKKNESLSKSLNREAGLFPYTGKMWLSNQRLLNNFTKLELILFIYITEAKDCLHRLHLSLDHMIREHYIDPLQLLESSKSHSTEIYYQNLEDVSNTLDEEGFIKKWEELIDQSLKKLEQDAEGMENRMELMDRSAFDNFKNSQFGEYRPITLRVKKLVLHILQKEFTEPVKELSHETLNWFTAEINESLTLAEKSLATLELIKNDSSLPADFPQMNSYISGFDSQLREAEKAKLRMLNQLKERTNALMDKFSINTITRRTNFLRKFIR